MCPPPQPKAKTAALLKATEGAMTGEDYDLMLHCTIGHLRRVDGALPPFADGEKALNLLAPKGEPRYILCIFCIYCIICILMLSYVLRADTVCALRSQSMGFGTFS